ncbi:hypothetical protein GCM10022393_17170 [Aquimarina addita]|uniref:Uncharacterized protein n=2 Tax=Aquimarina addita TaxID=870485 RepID=A0ABP7XJK8_9FLAO
MVGTGLTAEAQEDWTKLTDVFDQVYSLATDLNEQTDKVSAQASIISIVTGKGTVSVERRIDKSKPKELKHYQFFLLASNGKEIELQKLNAERVIETFQSKLLKVKEELRVNQDADVENILNNLFD